MNFKIALSMSATFPRGILQSMKLAYRHNFKGLEIIAEPPIIDLENIPKTFISSINELREAYNLELFVHAPLYDINPAGINEPIRKAVEKVLLDSIMFAHEINAKIIVIHPGLIFFPRRKYMKFVYSAFIRTLTPCVELAEDLDIKIALENRGSNIELGRTPDEIIFLLGLLDFPDNVGIAFDVVQAQLVMDPAEFYRKIAKYVIHMHIRDSPKNKDDLLAVGEGDIDFKGLFNEIIRHNYSGALVLEVRDITAALMSRKRILEIIQQIE